MYDTAGVDLDGTLVERRVFGPPGYGETPSKDQRLTILVIKLAAPINVKPTASASASNSVNLDSVKGVREVQLFIEHENAVRYLIGRSIMAVGTLNEAVSPSQYTKIWLDTQAVRPK